MFKSKKTINLTFASTVFTPNYSKWGQGKNLSWRIVCLWKGWRYEEDMLKNKFENDKAKFKSSEVDANYERES